MKYTSHSEQETKEIGKKIAAKLKGGEVLALYGDLGAGKTVLAKGIAEGLGYKKIVNSPTFVLMKIYKIKFVNFSHYHGKIPLNPPLQKGERIRNICHIDAYRISNVDETENIGINEYLGSQDTVSIIEWPERIKKILPKNTILVKLTYGKKENERKIFFKK